MDLAGFSYNAQKNNPVFTLVLAAAIVNLIETVIRFV